MPKNPSFEQALSRLEETVSSLEVGELTLEQATLLFEKGMALAALCSRHLNDAELRITQLKDIHSESVVQSRQDE